MKDIDVIEIIKNRMFEKKISKYKIAKEMKISQATVANWLEMKSFPDLPKLLELLNLLDLEIEIKAPN